MSDARVAVGIDETLSEPALDLAADEAVLLGCDLLVVSSYDGTGAQVWGEDDDPAVDDILHDTARSRARVAVARARTRHPGLTVTGETLRAPAADALVEYSESAALLILGSHRHGVAATLFLTSTSARVAARGRCPVIVVPGAAPSGDRTPADPHGPVVAGVDTPASAKAVLGFAFEHAARHRAPLRVVQCERADPLTSPDGSWARRLCASMQPQLDAAVAEWRASYPDVEVRSEVVVGVAAPTLIARAAGAALLVVGSHGHSALLGTLLGSVSQGVLHHATGPVAVVPV